MNDPAPVVYLTRDALRALFNGLLLHERMLAGEFTEHIDRSAPVTHEFLPPGSRSQVTSYYDRHGRIVATVHYYLCPDGTIGASGRPDPTYVDHRGTIYKYSAKREREAAAKQPGAQ